MEYVAAYSLISQNSSETLGKEALKTKITALLNAVQAPNCEESLDLFISKAEGKTFTEALAEGSELMKSQISSAPASNAGASNAAAAKVEKVVVKEEPESEEAALDFF